MPQALDHLDPQALLEAVVLVVLLDHLVRLDQAAHRVLEVLVEVAALAVHQERMGLQEVQDHPDLTERQVRQDQQVRLDLPDQLVQLDLVDQLEHLELALPFLEHQVI